MTTPITIKRSYSIPADHLECISRGISALTFDPYKNILYYLFPRAKAFFSSYQTLSCEPGQSAMMPLESTERILREITELKDLAGIQRDISAYVALNHQFASCGGSCSLMQPALFLPYQHLFRKEGHSPFGAERAEENLQGERWIFSDNETRFFIARELGQIKENSSLIKIAIKVCVIAALFAIYAAPFSWALAGSLFAASLGMYVISERYFAARADLIGVEILRPKIGREALQIAIDALEKMREQNLYRRQHSKIAKWYITANGNNVLDFANPYLTTRIARLRDRETIKTA